MHRPVHYVCPSSTPRTGLSNCQRGGCGEPRGDTYETVTFKTQGVNITTRTTAYQCLRYNRMPDQCIDRRSVDKSLYRSPRRSREHYDDAVATPTRKELPIGRKT